MKEMILSATQFLDKHKQAVNALNVFPVPDGDTGTNMSLTMLAAAKEVQGARSDSMAEVVNALASGALKGARGNSGVILSQLFRGFARALQSRQEITTSDYAEAMQAGVDTAYKAVMKPVEGTMLTVARVTAEEARKIAREQKDFNEFYKEIIKVAKRVLDKTPEMLPVLKQAGVVDAGGMGLLYIMIGASHALKGTFELDGAILAAENYSAAPKLEVRPQEDIEYGYCTEFLIKNLYPYVEEGDEENLRERLNKLGDSVLVIRDDDIIKVHVHTNMPGKVLQLGLRYGELSSIKIDNMREQHRHINEIGSEESAPQDDAVEKQFGVIAVAMGQGISSIFKDLAVDFVVEGGQTMNPSIDDLLKAIEKVKAKEIFILPNNGNIILSASQAQQISDKKIYVIPSKSIPQGIAAMLAFNPDVDAETNVQRMTAALSSVKTGQVTYAVRDSNFDGMSIQKGDILGLIDGKISVVGKDINEVTRGLIDNMMDDESEIITLYYGEQVSAQDAEAIADFVSSRYPDVEVEVHFGGQPLYYYIISVE
ncbi:DAK2 domain-containing protein [Caldicoprobacter algeriensis]|nr:DAK2 domain-containing protein [Caldicoprobacter algeriensis]MCM8899768.1 DAK2 domain-containing protein [Caldicoprobacter algeriensis]